MHILYSSSLPQYSDWDVAFYVHLCKGLWRKQVTLYREVKKEKTLASISERSWSHSAKETLFMFGCQHSVQVGTACGLHSLASSCCLLLARAGCLPCALALLSVLWRVNEACCAPINPPKSCSATQLWTNFRSMNRTLSEVGEVARPQRHSKAMHESWSFTSHAHGPVSLPASSCAVCSGGCQS